MKKKAGSLKEKSKKNTTIINIQKLFRGNNTRKQLKNNLFYGKLPQELQTIIWQQSQLFNKLANLLPKISEIEIDLIKIIDELKNRQKDNQNVSLTELYKQLTFDNYIKEAITKIESKIEYILNKMDSILKVIHQYRLNDSNSDLSELAVEMSVNIMYAKDYIVEANEQINLNYTNSNELYKTKKDLLENALNSIKECIQKNTNENSLSINASGKTQKNRKKTAKKSKKRN